MPKTFLDGREVKRWNVDGNIVRKAYLGGVLCHVRPYSATVASYGYQLDVSGVPHSKTGLYVEGVNIARTGRSYRVTFIGTDNKLTHSRSFDVCGSTSEASEMAAFLNAIPANNIVIVYTHDEPQSNRLSMGLQAAMERCGAGNLYSATTFNYRGAYALIGKAGVGKGNGYEAYAGSGSSTLDAKLEVNFSFIDSVISNIASVV